MIQTVWGLRVAVWGHVVLKYRGEVYLHGDTFYVEYNFCCYGDGGAWRKKLTPSADGNC